MRPAKPLPPSLRTWAEHAVGPLSAVRDASHPRENSRVWDLTDTRGRHFFVKQSPTPAFYERETFGYQSAVPALGFGRAPRLVDTDAHRLALLLTAVPGAPVSRLTLTVPEHRAAHRQFGTLLRRLHGTEKMPAQGRRAAEAAVEHTAAAAEKHLARAGDRLSEDRRTLVRRAADHLLRLTDLLAPGHIHGDAQERNALWSGPQSRPGPGAGTGSPPRSGSGRLAMIDFERSRYAPVVQDFVRLACGPWQDRDDLRTAFFQGYGRPLTDAERHALPCLAALDAASCLTYGPAHGEHDVTERGLRTLDRLEKGIFSR
ncbi:MULTISPECIES: aminoglycoside phosphotransferase family protein [unclassified Streptomyces]|uniref:phosphotransferase enzyme family protein n=1 Tax=unclassified Streptomyces TaxID=2593676 RepID=UPI00081F6A33|nr:MULTISPECIES: aminoglycoside phosphotransferase family protein [unclassified Streptomyces]MYZ39107.1 phosphotransferase [Streptomyces sp. SID4917]SCG02189.1 Phosphotransferase enzyme family protein [Streptomyces sp. MnatMP-M17]